jgi:hypothetical protein
MAERNKGTLDWTKKQVKAVADVLDQDHETLEDAAVAALDAALSIIEDRAKFAVVGQVRHTAEHGDIPPSHEAAVKVCLGLFESDTKANEAAGQMTNNAAGDLLRTWVVPMFFGTPSAWHKKRRDELAAMETKADQKRREKFLKSIEDQERRMHERAAEIQAMEKAAGGQQWPCPSSRIKAGDCRHTPTCK